MKLEAKYKLKTLFSSLRPVFLAGLIISFFTFFNSCKKEEFEKGTFNLEFSEDTIIFDTVFTTVGSSTELFIIYNRGDDAVKINSIRVAGGENSNYRLNVDGIPGKSFSDVEIGGNDSIFVFVEVTVDPNNANTPLIVADSVVVTGNGFTGDVKLVAWGQDAHFHVPDPNSGISPFFFVGCNEVWNNDKPHVVYGIALVDSACTLTINAGVNVYMHPGSGIYVMNTGSLQILGTQTDKVTIQGDRLGEEYKDIPGQWDRIWLSTLNVHTEGNGWPGTQNSVIKHAIIKNGVIGLLVDSSIDADTNHLTVDIENTIIKNMASYGLVGQDANVRAMNCVFANCGAQTTLINYGGKYDFYHCTFANYWSNGQRQDPAVTMNNVRYLPTYTEVRSLSATFGNCIIYGSNDNELAYDSASFGDKFKFKFDHSLIKVENTFNTSDPSRYINIIKSQDPKFVDTEQNNYELDSASSPAIDKGEPAFLLLYPVLNTDLNGNSRLNGTGIPDMGAYERR